MNTLQQWEIYLSKSPLETERWSVPESAPSDNDPSSSGSTEPARGLLRLLLEPLLDPSIWEAKEGTLLRRWRLPIELCSDMPRFAWEETIFLEQDHSKIAANSICV